MNETVLIVDSSALVHRAFHTTSGLTRADGKPSGVVFGFLKSLHVLAKKWRTGKFVFTWDSRLSVRRDFYPEYKANRKLSELTTDERKQVMFRRWQERELRNIILPSLGFHVQYLVDGFEADDIIAERSRVLSDSAHKNNVVIVSSDSDLFQCLYANVCMDRGKKGERCYDRSDFRAEFDIKPEQWWMVKAIAGCPTDNVPGVPGVGIKTAVKFMTDGLKTKSKAYKACHSMTSEFWNRQAGLVRLPHPDFKALSDIEFAEPYLRTVYTEWQNVCDEWSLETMRSHQFVRELLNRRG